MSKYILILLLLFLCAGSAIYSSKIVKADAKLPIPNKAPVKNVQSAVPMPKHNDSKLFNCSNPNGYQIKTERNDEFNFVNIVQDDKIVETLKLPTGLSQNGFALNWARKTKFGFEISIEYGSRVYYQKQFNFVCKNHQLYLTTINTITFDKHDPEKPSKKYKTDIKPNVPLLSFKVANYISN